MKPVLQALVVADHIYEDKLTNKKVIAGIFSCLAYSESLPVQETKDTSGETHQRVLGGLQSGSPWVYINMTEVQGTQLFVLRYVDLTDYSVLLETKFTIQSEDRLATSELSVPLPKLPTPHPGVYAIELLWNDEPLGSLRVVVKRLSENEDKAEGET